MPMRRKCTEALLQWKKNPHRRPLVLSGGRQTGKTWLLRDFGEKHYESTLYINLETDQPVSEFLSVPREAEEVLLFLETYGNKPIWQSTTLLILDNMHRLPTGPQLLEKIGLDFPGYHIVVSERIGNPRNSRYASGDVDSLFLFPMDLEEFLWANKEFSLAKEIREHFLSREPIKKTLHERAMAQLRLYLAIGGMPGAICEYRQEKKLLLVPDIQKQILSLFLADITEFAPEGAARHSRNCFYSVPSQLCRENSRFQYRHVVKGGTARLYEPPLQWLTHRGLLYRSSRHKAGETAEDTANRFYFPDTGLFTCQLGVPAFLLLSGEPTPQTHAILEAYLAQTFVQNGYNLSYWTSGNQAYIPFLLQKEGETLAVDFRLDSHTRNRNLARYEACGETGKRILFSTENFHTKDRYEIMPLYAAFCL